MGCGASSPMNEDGGAKQRSDSIERQLKEDARLARSEVKMLLLGAGESGKSTIVKQMRLIHQQPWSSEERYNFREVVWSNTVQSMRVLVDGAASMAIPLEPDCQHHAEAIMSAPPQIEGDVLPRDLAAAIQHLWADEGIREAFDKRSRLQLNDSAGYFFDALDRTSTTAYSPSDDDILRSRVKSTGIMESSFLVGETTFRIFDVGGQRSERKKWIHCFSDVNALIFIVAISEYDQSLYEDEEVNRLVEAQILFDSVINSRWFESSTRIVFFNKIDLARAKLAREPLSTFFPEFQGDSINEALDFLALKFTSLNKTRNKVYAHQTTATDTQQVKFVMHAVQDTILNQNLASAGFV